MAKSTYSDHTLEAFKLIYARPVGVTWTHMCALWYFGPVTHLPPLDSTGLVRAQGPPVPRTIRHTMRNTIFKHFKVFLSIQ